MDDPKDTANPEGGRRSTPVDEMLPLVYDELRQVAAGYLRHERAGHTLQPTALVNEVYLRLAQHREMEIESRAHLFGIAASQMRRILVDHARSRSTAKRGGEFVRIEFEDGIATGAQRDEELIALDTALDALATTDERLGRVVELRYFGGLTIEETAKVLAISEATVEREWTAARAWLRRALRRGLE